MLQVAAISWSFADDVIFDNMALVLYANGCKWACPGCHNKKLQCFEDSDILAFDNNHAIISYIKTQLQDNAFLRNNLTIVGSGGDFFFQLHNWLLLCQQIKQLWPEIKILWYTGAEHTQANLSMISYGANNINGILWGKLSVKNGYVIKQLSKSHDSHKRTSEICISPYNNQFEEK